MRRRERPYIFKRTGEGAYRVWSRETCVWLGEICFSVRSQMWFAVDCRGLLVVYGYRGSRDSVAHLLRSRVEEANGRLIRDGSTVSSRVR